MTQLSQAIALLRDEHLVHSEDFELIRLPLADLLTKIDQSPSHQFDDEVDAITRPIVAGETSVTIPEPLEAWMKGAAHELGIYSVASNESPTLRHLVRRIFGTL